MTSPRLEKHSPTSTTTASAHSDSGDCDRPMAHTTTRRASPERNSLAVTHSNSASTTSSRATGAFMMASQVRCTCMREKPEYRVSNVALLVVEKHTVPAARKATYDTPATEGSS